MKNEKFVAIWCDLNTRPSAISQRQKQTKRGKWRNLQWEANGNRESYNLSSSLIAQSETVHRDEAVC